MSQRRWGITRCQKFLRGLDIAETKQIGTLTERQRLALADRLDARGQVDAARCADREMELVGA
jgi:hypothetical protein